MADICAANTCAIVCGSRISLGISNKEVKTMSKIHIVMALIVLISFSMAILLYDQMPDQMASHWNIRGEVDGYMPKATLLFLFPGMNLLLFILLLVLPLIDPLRKNIEDFRTHYDSFILVIIVFLTFIYLITLLWNLGAEFEMNRVISPAFAILFFYIGTLFYKLKRNWTIGIRNRWTLSSDYVWDHAHRLGGMLFILAGIISLFGVVFPMLAMIFILAPALSTAFILPLYSYVLYNRTNQESKTKTQEPKKQEKALRILPAKAKAKEKPAKTKLGKNKLGKSKSIKIKSGKKRPGKNPKPKLKHSKHKPAKQKKKR